MIFWKNIRSVFCSCFGFRFSTDRSVYDAITEESSRRETEPYLLTYILDSTPEKKEANRFLSEKLGLRAVHILDGTPRKEDIRIVAQRVQAPPQPLWKKIFSRLPESVQKGIKEKAGKYR